MKTIINKLTIVLTLVFAMSSTINAQEVCNDPAACNYMMANDNEPCVYIITSEMISNAQAAVDLAQNTLEAALEAYEASSSASMLIATNLLDSQDEVQAAAESIAIQTSEIDISQVALTDMLSNLENIIQVIATQAEGLSNLEISLDLEEVAMIAANLALQGAQEYLSHTENLYSAALGDFEVAEFENFDAAQAVNDAWEAYNFASNLQDNALEALGISQLEQEATQYAVDLGMSTLNAASEELINAFGAIGLAQEATIAKESIVATAQASMEAAVAALELAQAVSDAALTDFNAAEVENFDLATSVSDALALQTFYQDAMANALEELGIAQAQQESTQYAADLAASALNQASDELIGALGAIGLAEEATAAKAAILSGANAGMDAAQDALDIAQSGVDLANAAVAEAYSGVAAAQSALNSENALTSSTQYAWDQANNYYNSLDLELCTYTPEIAAVWTPAVESYIITPAVSSYLITSAVSSVCTGGYYQTITPAIPAVTSWVPEVCLPWVGCSGGYYQTITPAIPAVTALVPEVCTPYIPAVWSPSVPAVWSPYIPSAQISPYIPSTNICVPNPEVALAYTAISAAATPYYAAQGAMEAAQLALTGVLATQSAAQVVVDQATSVLNDALSAVQDQIAIVQNAQGDLDLAEEAENNANAAYQAAQDPVAVAEEVNEFANDAAALALQAAGDWQALYEQNAGNALAALNTYEVTAPLAEAAELALEGVSAAMEIANSQYNDALQEHIDKIAMFQNAQTDLDLAEEAENNANAAYQAAQDPEAAAQAGLDLAQTAADHAVSVVGDAQVLVESGAGNMLALLSDYEALAPLAELAEAGLDLATAAVAEANTLVSGALAEVNEQLAGLQTQEFENLTALVAAAVSTIEILNVDQTSIQANIESAQDLLAGMNVEAQVLSDVWNLAVELVGANEIALIDATSTDAINNELRTVAENNVLAAASALGGMTMSNDCAMCDTDENGNGYVNANEDVDGSCILVEAVVGCTNEIASNYNADATEDDQSCVSWADLAASLQNELDNIDITIDNQAVADEAYGSGYGDGFIAGSANSTTAIDLPLDLPSGWSIFGYTCNDSQDVIESLSTIASEIEIIKDEWGMSYLPEWGFNAIGDFTYSEGYQIKLYSTVDGFQFCKTLIQE